MEKFIIWVYNCVVTAAAHPYEVATLIALTVGVVIAAIVNEKR